MVWTAWWAPTGRHNDCIVECVFGFVFVVFLEAWQRVFILAAFFKGGWRREGGGGSGHVFGSGRQVFGWETSQASIKLSEKKATDSMCQFLNGYTTGRQSETSNQDCTYILQGNLSSPSPNHHPPIHPISSPYHTLSYTHSYPSHTPNYTLSHTQTHILRLAHHTTSTSHLTSCTPPKTA